MIRAFKTHSTKTPSIWSDAIPEASQKKGAFPPALYLNTHCLPYSSMMLSNYGESNFGLSFRQINLSRSLSTFTLYCRLTHFTMLATYASSRLRMTPGVGKHLAFSSFIGEAG